MMLSHLGLAEHANKVQNAWLKTIEDGMHTADIFGEMSKKKLGTKEFAEAVIDRMGEEPSLFRPAKIKAGKHIEIHAVMAEQAEKRELIGADLFVGWRGKDINELGTALEKLSTEALKLQLLSCKGLKVWPNIVTEMDFTDRFRARYLPVDGKVVTLKDVAALMTRAADQGVDFLKVETLYKFDGKAGYSASQGE
jgi:isocitrate dehydrogenase